ncbi:MAG: DUF7305 domain-containing protein [Planctomycetota bacterium]
MSRKTFLQSSRPASVLTVSLIVIILLFTAGLGMLQCGLQARVYAVRTSDDIAAQTAADAGLTNALWKLNRKVKTKYAAQELPALYNQNLKNCSADYSYEVSIPPRSFFHVESVRPEKETLNPFTAKLPYAYRYVIKSVGRSGNAEKTLHATVKLQGLFEYALLSQGKIDLAPNTLITGYNSKDPTDTAFDVKIGTTSTRPDSIPMSPGTVIKADVFVGVGANPQEVIGEGGKIEGNTFALTEQIRFPAVTPPPLKYLGTTISAKGETLTLRPADSGIYRAINLVARASNPGVLAIEGGQVTIRLDEDIYLGNDTDIIVKNGSSLVIYTEGDIAMGNSAGFVNENSSGSTLKIFATGGTADDTQKFELKAKTTVFGVVYAPNADLELYPKAEFYGAVTGNNIAIKSNGVFFYDEALREVSPADQGVRFVIEKWWE